MDKQSKSLAAKNPELAKQWHPSMNENLTPFNVTAGSGKKIWWQCEKGHEWEARIYDMSRGKECPFCTGLQALNPNLAKQWHPFKNLSATPYTIKPGSPKKAWWICEKGHEWEAVIASRNNGIGCPYCSGKRASSLNNLMALNPDLAKQWHLIKNGNLTPSDVTEKSHKKVWWLCEIGHEWEATISHRSNGTGCPFCAGKSVGEDNSLQTLNLDLARQWSPIRNGSLTPKDVTSGSNKNVWWVCEKGHEWEATISNRTKGHGCPYCSGRNAFVDNNLQTLNPELAKEWHPVKNEDLTPNDVTVSSHKKVWWQCEKGHEWKSHISNRSKGTGCPECSKELRTSFPEQAIYFYLKSIFTDSLNGYKYDDKWEIDVFVPSLNLGIEYDGVYFHDENRTSDFEKEKYLVDKGLSVLRVKEVSIKKKECYLKDNVIFLNARFSRQLLNKAIKLCIGYISENITHIAYDIDIDIEQDRNEIYELYIQNEKRNSLLSHYPELSEQWHPIKNLSVRPDMVRPGSGKKVWWQCEKNHEWEATIASRAKGIGCPFCSGKRASDENNLQFLNPDLAEQWHHTKNVNLTPHDVTAKSNKKVWWQCEKGHEWEAAINNRARGDDCPYCSGKSVSFDNNLLTLNPELAKQWHPSLNNDLTPDVVSAKSGKKVWWQCEKGHEWEAAIYSRTSGKGCPYCSGRRASSDNSLQVLNPDLAKQWHPFKNGDLTPNDVKVGSGKKVWWQCVNGHEWDAIIQSRKNSIACPYCLGKRR